ncbi:MAG TPA: PaaI family thioesterase [Actinomycetota bacterium]|nr:PaaI family thioesterase [Actinomycetota bacterium]
MQHYDTPDPHARPLTTGIVQPEVWAEKSFLEILSSITAGDLPVAPFVQLFGLSRPVAREGYLETSMKANAWFTSPAGTIYGGVLAYLADSVLTGAIATTAPANSVCAPLDLKVNFLRPAFPDGRTHVAKATVVHRGQTLALAECEILNGDNKVVVKATSSATIIEGRNWAPAVLDETPVAETTDVKA